MASFKLDAIDKQILECQSELRYLRSGGAVMLEKSVSNLMMQSEFAEDKKAMMVKEIDVFLGGDMNPDVVEGCYDNLILLLSGTVDLKFSLPCVKPKSLQEDYNFFSGLATYIFPLEADRRFENVISGTGFGRKLSITWQKYNKCIEIYPDFAVDKNHVVFNVKIT